MTEDDIRGEVMAALAEIAPEGNVSEIVAEQAFRDQMDIDSVDFLNFVLTVEKRLGVTVPEGDYPKLASLDGAVAYLHQRSAEPVGAERGG